jgi:hypothetical protein
MDRSPADYGISKQPQVVIAGESWTGSIGRSISRLDRERAQVGSILLANPV